MKKINLEGEWRLKQVHDTDWIKAFVPGSVASDLLKAGKIDNPFYRDNEEQVLEAFLNDYIYHKEFKINQEFFKYDKIFLCCEGLDTLSEIEINGKPVATTSNMHRIYQFEVARFLEKGRNRIRITFRSPVKYIQEKQQQKSLNSPGESIPGSPHIRKAHYMFGWDWGPKVPDMGIWRDIYLAGYKQGKLEDVYIKQEHDKDKVNLRININHQQWTKEPLKINVKLITPDGKEITENNIVTANTKNYLKMKVEDPLLWWPKEYGPQYLYHVEVELIRDDFILDSSNFKIGLRTIQINQEKDEWGESFAFKVNGVSLFAKGANYIPEDNFLARNSKDKTEELIKDCVDANFNCLRIWGGGFYPHDYFYELCDQYGIIVWQDFMFANSHYLLTQEFKDNVLKEVEDNVKRFRNHASLGLWCGNNEIERGWVRSIKRGDNDPENAARKADYLKLFEIFIPEIVNKLDPETFYWPSSPSSGGGFVDTFQENIGDEHYWRVWHGEEPFSSYKKKYFRFCSEFGFQSFPELKTIKSFTLPEDRNIFSYVMEKHQKNNSGNGKILYYLSKNFKYPKDLTSLIYISQLLQAEAIKTGVEHWRRHRGRCMGALYWQLNDCWPVASWSSIDYYHRWKALHYFAKRFFAPVLLSVDKNNLSCDMYLINDTREKVSGTVIWEVKDNYANILKKSKKKITIKALNSKSFESLDFSQELAHMDKRRNVYLEYRFESKEHVISNDTTLFVKPKHFNLIEPELTFNVKENDQDFIVSIDTNAFTRYVELSLENKDCKFSDNYFDLSADNTKEIFINKDKFSEEITANEIRENLNFRSLINTYE